MRCVLGTVPAEEGVVLISLAGGSEFVYVRAYVLERYTVYER